MHNVQQKLAAGKRYPHLQVDTDWLLLVYTVPAEPTRLRAAVWRDLKRSGAVYLRDGACALPDEPAARRALRAVAARIRSLGGQATLATGAHLAPADARAVRARLRQARVEEYAEIASEAEQLLEHLDQEASHRALAPADLRA